MKNNVSLQPESKGTGTTENHSQSATSDCRYINPLTDYGFKKIFSDEDVMIAFLTDLLQPASPITSVTFLDKEMAAESEVTRGVVYDLRCKTADGGEFIVEMQNRWQEHFSDRILFYLSRSFSMQEHRGNNKWGFRLQPVYGVFLLNFHLKGFQPQSIRTIQMRVDETGELFTEKVRAYTLELPDYRDKPADFPKSRIEYWLYVLSNMETMTTALPFQNEQPIFNKVGTIAELVHMTPDELTRYNISLDTYRTNLMIMKTERSEGRAEGREEGLAEGLAIGREEGREEENKRMAKKMKQLGMPIETIIEITGLSAESIADL